MSRARAIHINGKEHWMDMNRNGQIATDEQLELLSTVEQIDLDDLLDENLTQGEVIKRLRRALGHDPIPQEVIERRQRWREQRQRQPECRNCGKVGDSTRHHFINKWILKELHRYHQKWSDRSKNCIPLCIECHREFHSRANGPHSIRDLLSEEERAFAQAALEAFEQEHPRIMLIMARGDSSVYESRLIKDYLNGEFLRKENVGEESKPVEVGEIRALEAVA